MFFALVVNIKYLINNSKQSEGIMHVHKYRNVDNLLYYEWNRYPRCLLLVLNAFPLQSNCSVMVHRYMAYILIHRSKVQGLSNCTCPTPID